MPVAPSPKKRKGKLPQRLQAIREKLGLNIAQAAAKIKVSRAAWSDWETGKYEPTPPMLFLIELLDKGQI